MNPLMHLGLCLTLSASALLGQALDERLAPKTPPRKGGKTKLPEPPASPQPSAEEEAPLADKLNGLLILRSKDEIKREGVENVAGLQISDIALIRGPEFAKQLQPYFGKPVSLRTLKEMQRKIVLFCREHDRPLVDVIVPNQEVKNGVVQMVLIEGRLGNITVKNEGTKWFKDEVITRGIRAASGDLIREKQLLSDVNWMNRNPFREVSLAFKQGERPGLSDLQLQVEDRFPLRVFAGYEDTGSRITGEDRLVAGFNWGNVFGLDHQLNYQFTTDPDFKTLTANSGSYVIPLPWRHVLTVFGSHVDITAETTATNVSQTGLNYQGSLRYSIPLPLLNKYQHEFFIGFDYKHNKNDLLFRSSAATLPISDTKTDVNQLAAGYSSLLTDRWGHTSLGVQGYYSPGGLYGKNDDSAFDAEHKGAKSSYLYGRVTAERITRLPWDFSWVLRLTGQDADGNLVASEQLGVGGFSSVRGYDEREVNGDRGFYMNNELRAPPFSLLRIFGKAKLADQLQFLGFWDYGLAENKDPLSNESTAHLQSVGGGLRYTVNRYLSVRFDYGIQLMDSGPTASNYGSRGHVGVIASF